jgi:hypothetical protein
MTDQVDEAGHLWKIGEIADTYELNRSSLHRHRQHWEVAVPEPNQGGLSVDEVVALCERYRGPVDERFFSYMAPIDTGDPVMNARLAPRPEGIKYLVDALAKLIELEAKVSGLMNTKAPASITTNVLSLQGTAVLEFLNEEAPELLPKLREFLTERHADQH